MKLKPSAEQLFDGDERAVLGLIWAIMLKYKFWNITMLLVFIIIYYY